MKTEIEIKSGLYSLIENSALNNAISGVINISVRPDGSDKEDAIISVLESNCEGDIQTAILNVNIYVPDIRVGGQYMEDITRLNELSRLSAELLATIIDADGGRFELSSQRVLHVNGKNEHFINNRIKYKSVK